MTDRGKAPQSNFLLQAEAEPALSQRRFGSTLSHWPSRLRGHLNSQGWSLPPSHPTMKKNFEEPAKFENLPPQPVLSQT